MCICIIKHLLLYVHPCCPSGSHPANKNPEGLPSAFAEPVAEWGSEVIPCGTKEIYKHLDYLMRWLLVIVNFNGRTWSLCFYGNLAQWWKPLGWQLDPRIKCQHSQKAPPWRLNFNLFKHQHWMVDPLDGDPLNMWVFEKFLRLQNSSRNHHHKTGSVFSICIFLP